MTTHGPDDDSMDSFEALDDITERFEEIQKRQAMAFSHYEEARAQKYGPPPLNPFRPVPRAR